MWFTLWMFEVNEKDSWMPCNDKWSLLGLNCDWVRCFCSCCHLVMTVIYITETTKLNKCTQQFPTAPNYNKMTMMTSSKFCNCLTNDLLHLYQQHRKCSQARLRTCFQTGSLICLKNTRKGKRQRQWEGDKRQKIQQGREADIEKVILTLELWLSEAVHWNYWTLVARLFHSGLLFED